MCHVLCEESTVYVQIVEASRTVTLYNATNVLKYNIFNNFSQCQHHSHDKILHNNFFFLSNNCSILSSRRVYLERLTKTEPHQQNCRISSVNLISLKLERVFALPFLLKKKWMARLMWKKKCVCLQRLDYFCHWLTNSWRNSCLFQEFSFRKKCCYLDWIDFQKSY